MRVSKKKGQGQFGKLKFQLELESLIKNFYDTVEVLELINYKYVASTRIGTFNNTLKSKIVKKVFNNKVV